MLMDSMNILLCLYFGFNTADYASSYLLIMFMGSLFLFMKFYTGEKMTWSCYIYIFCMLATAFPSLYFFTTIERSSDLSPAESRMLNRPCTLFNFYDYHDIWHFLGGAGVFFTFMFILNIDEDVKYRRRDKQFYNSFTPAPNIVLNELLLAVLSDSDKLCIETFRPRFWCWKVTSHEDGWDGFQESFCFCRKLHSKQWKIDNISIWNFKISQQDFYRVLWS